MVNNYKLNLNKRFKTISSLIQITNTPITLIIKIIFLLERMA